MGNLNSSSNNELLKRSNVKLQAQQVVSYNGNSLKWHSWNKKMKAAVGTAGMLRVLEDQSYAKSHKVDNETVFHLLQVATADGNAAHLVDKFESEKDGHKAYQELVKWFEGDELTTETAEDIRSKLDKLSLTTKNTASKYINQFLQYTKHLDELNESYTQSKTVNIFLTQITDPDYFSTVEHCMENKLDINECIERIRAKERRLDRQRTGRIKSPMVIRRQNNYQNNREKGKVLRLEDFKTPRGYYSIPSDEWINLTEDDKEYVKSHNGKLRRERDDTNHDGNGSPTKRSRRIQMRRNTAKNSNEEVINEEATNASPVNKRAVQFKDRENKTEFRDEKEDASEIQSGEPRNIVRRGALRFKVKDDE